MYLWAPLAILLMSKMSLLVFPSLVVLEPLVSDFLTQIAAAIFAADLYGFAAAKGGPQMTAGKLAIGFYLLIIFLLSALDVARLATLLYASKRVGRPVGSDTVADLVPKLLIPLIILTGYYYFAVMSRRDGPPNGLLGSTGLAQTLT